jgi:glycerol-3-phosphate dehydrogenase (NAD(P)+)
MEVASSKLMPELFEEILPKHRFAVIGGPMLADEIMADLRAACVVASKDMVFAEEIEALLSSPLFRIEPSSDVTGVALAGVLKNIYSVSLGIADGLSLSGNEKGWLVSRAINEMSRIGEIFNVPIATVLGTAGVGDFIATGYSQYSRNRAVGDEIVKNGICKLPGEGLVSLPALLGRLKEDGTGFRLLDLVKRVGIDCEPAQAAFDHFFMNGK